MNHFVKESVEGIILKKKKDIPEMIAIQAMHYVMGVVAGINRVNLRAVKSADMPINYYGVSFANSGRGKDLSVSVAKSIVGDCINLYAEELTSIINSSDLTREEISIPALEHKEGTASGFLQDRLLLDSLGLGCTNVRVEELVSVLKSSDFEQVINLLTESWQEGSNSARAFKTYNSPKINSVPTNCLLYSSPEGFRNNSNKQFANFVDNLANGLARRAFVVFDETEVTIEDMPTAEEILIEADELEKSKELLTELKAYALDCVKKFKKNKVITIDAEKELLIREYDNKCRKFTIDNVLIKNALKAEMLSRAFKVRRLAGLYAMFDGSHEVSEKNILDAIEWADKCHKSLIIVLNAETTAEKIYDYLNKVGKYSSQTDICKYYNINARDFKDNIDEVFTVAYDKGDILQAKIFDREAKVMKYNLLKGVPTEPDKMIVSASNQMAHNFKPLSIHFRDLPKLTSGVYGSEYCCGTFVDNHRLIDNYIQRANVIMFDVDDGTSIEDALILLSQYRGYITTTKNHQKIKGNKPACDRFRVVLVSKYEFSLNYEDFKESLSTFATYHSLDVDFPAIEPARKYTANPSQIVYELGGDELVDIRQYIPETKDVKNISDAIKYADSKSTTGLERFFLQRIVNGSRNNELFKFGVALITKKNYSLEEACGLVRHLNNKIADPLNESELDRTIFKSLERKA